MTYKEKKSNVFERLSIYLHEYIDEMKPVTLEYQIKLWGRYGYIEEGHNGKDFPSFETWLKLRYTP